MTAYVLGAAAAHAVTAVAVARMAFGHVRARILQSATSYHEWSGEARIQGAGVVLTVTCLAGFWPLLLATAVVMARPAKTPGEVQAELKRQAKRVAELERELGIKP